MYEDAGVQVCRSAVLSRWRDNLNCCLKSIRRQLIKGDKTSPDADTTAATNSSSGRGLGVQSGGPPIQHLRPSSLGGKKKLCTSCIPDQFFRTQDKRNPSDPVSTPPFSHSELYKTSAYPPSSCPSITARIITDVFVETIIFRLLKLPSPHQDKALSGLS